MKNTSLFLVLGMILAVACSDGSRTPTDPWHGRLPSGPLFDDIPNSIDASVDATPEAMALLLGGPDGSTSLYVVPRNGDGKNGCNLTGSTTLVVSVSSSNAAVATVSPSSITFESCGDTPALTVTPVGIGSATISLSQTSSTSEGTFDLGPATFTVNVTSPPVTDTTPPMITYEISGTLGNNGWYTSDVTLTWTVTENETPGSLVKYGCVNQSITSDQAATAYSCSASSDGGSTDPVEVTIKRDATAPTASASAAPAPNGTGWNNTNVIVSFSGSDDLSGIASCSSPVTLSSEGAGQSASGTCTDNAGNVSASAMASGINIDKTNPVVSVTGVGNGQEYILGSVPTAGCSTSDALSGVATDATLQPLSGGPLGSVTATCSGAKDNADNTGSATVTYTVIYDWAGFFRPVDNLPTLNSAKAGSAIPVKFSLGGNQGLGIFSAGYPASRSVACESGATADVIEETVTAGGSSLSYDPIENQYVYVWKTEKSYANTCRQLIVKLIDGTVHTASFKFAK